MRQQRRVRMFLFGAVLLLFAWALSAAAQENCPVLTRETVQQTQTSCTDVQEGRLCAGSGSVKGRTLGNDRINLELKPGETLDFAAVDWIDSGVGVALGLMSAYTDASWQPEPVHVLIFGDVSWVRIADPVPSLDAQVMLRQGANLRARPADTAPILDAAALGDVLKLTGRSRDGSWLRVQFADGRSAWVITAALAAQDFDTLALVEDPSETLPLLSAPFQNSVFGSGIEQGPCRERDQAGILLQSAADAPVLRWMANGIGLRWRGTILLQAYLGDIMRVTVLEGYAELLSEGGTQRVEAGSFTSILLREPDEDESLIEPPLPYDGDAIAKLPLSLLPRLVYPVVDLSRWISPRPVPDRSPLDGMLATDACHITTGPGGSNLRAGPGREYPVRGVMDFRESAAPIGRAIAVDGSLWWRIAPFVWVNAATTITGGDCVAVPQAAPDQLGP